MICHNTFVTNFGRKFWGYKPDANQKPLLLEQVRQSCRQKHFSLKQNTPKQ